MLQEWYHNRMRFVQGACFIKSFCGGKSAMESRKVIDMPPNFEDLERLEQMEDELDVLLAYKAMQESEGVVFWEEALKEL
jgi:hypothetical protein